jgi:16S rRNA (uracil1498-N3)-methyltransferase
LLEVRPVQTLDAVCDDLDSGNALRFMLQPGCEHSLTSELIAAFGTARRSAGTSAVAAPLSPGAVPQPYISPRSLVLLVGPEGGLSPGEAARARVAGYRPVTLGPRVLRTETAALAALAALRATIDDFSPAFAPQ